jgi:hypothetical protein
METLRYNRNITATDDCGTTNSTTATFTIEAYGSRSYVQQIATCADQDLVTGVAVSGTDNVR